MVFVIFDRKPVYFSPCSTTDLDPPAACDHDPRAVIPDPISLIAVPDPLYLATTSWTML